MTTLSFRRPTAIMINGLIDIVEPETATVLAWIATSVNARSLIVLAFALYGWLVEVAHQQAARWLMVGIWSRVIGYEAVWWGLCRIETGVVI